LSKISELKKPNAKVKISNLNKYSEVCYQNGKAMTIVWQVLQFEVCLKGLSSWTQPNILLVHCETSCEFQLVKVNIFIIFYFNMQNFTSIKISILGSV
jgi:hypothetical protein